MQSQEPPAGGWHTGTPDEPQLCHRQVGPLRQSSCTLGIVRTTTCQTTVSVNAALACYKSGGHQKRNNVHTKSTVTRQRQDKVPITRAHEVTCATGQARLRLQRLPTRILAKLVSAPMAHRTHLELAMPRAIRVVASKMTSPWRKPQYSPGPGGLQAASAEQSCEIPDCPTSGTFSPSSCDKSFCT